MPRFWKPAPSKLTFLKPIFIRQKIGTIICPRLQQGGSSACPRTEFRQDQWFPSLFASENDRTNQIHYRRLKSFVQFLGRVFLDGNLETLQIRSPSRNRLQRQLNALDSVRQYSHRGKGPTVSTLRLTQKVISKNCRFGFPEESEDCSGRHGSNDGFERGPASPVHLPAMEKL